MLLILWESVTCNDTTAAGHVLSASAGVSKAEVEDIKVPEYKQFPNYQDWCDKVTNAFKVKGANHYLVSEESCRKNSIRCDTFGCTRWKQPVLSRGRK